MFDPWFSNAGVTGSDGPVASLRVQAAEVRVASVREPIASHLVVERDMGTPFQLASGGNGDVNLVGASGVF